MRPSISYRDQGQSGFYSHIGWADCPYPVDSLKAMEWRSGWLKAAIGSGNFSADEAERFRLDMSLMDQAVARHRVWVRSLGPIVAEVEQICGPVDLWPEDRVAVAMELAESGILDRLIPDLGRYQGVCGCYVGEVAPGAILGARDEEGISHGWIEFEIGLVMDPTRWALRGGDPDLAIESLEDYDLGGLMTRRHGQKDAPPSIDADDSGIEVDGMRRRLVERLHGLLGTTSRVMNDGIIGRGQLIWVGRRTLEELGEEAFDLHHWLEDRRLLGVLPVDSRKYLSNLLDWYDEPVDIPRPQGL